MTAQSTNLPKISALLQGGLMGYFFLLPWISFFEARSMGSYMLALAAPLTVVLLWQQRGLRLKFGWPYAFLLAAFCLAVSGCLLSPFPDKAWDSFQRTLPVLILLPFFLMALSRVVLDRYASALLWGTVFGCLLLIAQLYMHTSFTLLFSTRSPQFWDVYLNRGVVVLTLALLLCLPLLQARKQTSSAALLGLLGTLLIFLTESDAAKLAWLAGLTCLLLARLIGTRNCLALCFGSMIAITLSLPFVYQALLPLLEKIAPLWGAQTSFARLEIWQLVTQQIMMAPLIGHGIEAVKLQGLGPLEATRYLAHYGTILHPHNIALQIWLEFGAIGACLTALGLGLAWWQTTQAPEAKQRVIICVSVGIFCIALTGYGLWQAWLLSTGLTMASLAARFPQPVDNYSAAE